MKLDGGSMFGNAPKALWASWMPADDNNMIEIASNCLLVRTHRHNILFETGAGAYLSPDMKNRFRISNSGHVLLDSLSEQGLSHEDISHVILSHLHFDHAGGLLAPWKPEENLSLLFNNAEFIVGKANFDRALTPHARDRASFIPGLARMLGDTGRLVLKKGGDRVAIGDIEIEFSESHGHTPGMLVSWIRAGDRTLVYTGDLIPAHPWVNLPITMGYDRFAEGLIDEKKELLGRALAEDALLVFPHDPKCAAAFLEEDPLKKKVVPSDMLLELKMAV